MRDASILPSVTLLLVCGVVALLVVIPYAGGVAPTQILRAVLKKGVESYRLSLHFVKVHRLNKEEVVKE